MTKKAEAHAAMAVGVSALENEGLEVEDAHIDEELAMHPVEAMLSGMDEDDIPREQRIHFIVSFGDGEKQEIPDEPDDDMRPIEFEDEESEEEVATPEQ